MTKKSSSNLQNTFKSAIDQVPCLCYKQGLSAIKKKDKGKISAADSRRILGSVDIDKDADQVFPQDNRWDYAIGYNRRNGVIVFFVEVHPAMSCEVATVARKLQWLKIFISKSCSTVFTNLRKEYHWVASNGIHIPAHVPQYKTLQKLGKDGLQGPSKILKMF